MSISPLGGQERLRAAAAASRAHAASTTANAAAAQRQAADTVSISDSARSLSAAHQAVANSPDVREDRVTTLKAAIADGTYNVDSRALAVKLLKIAQSS